MTRSKKPPLAIVEHQRDKAMADYEQAMHCVARLEVDYERAMHRVARLEAALHVIRETLQYASDQGQITDTIWMPERESFSETLFDYIDSVIGAQDPEQREEAAP